MFKSIKSLLSLLLLISSIGLIGCSKTEEGEIKRQASLTEKITELKGEFPQLAVVMDGEVARSKAEFEAAKKEENKEERIKKMAEANGIMADVTSKLHDFKGKVTSMEALLKKAKKFKKDEEIKKAYKKAKDELKDAKKDIYKKLVPQNLKEMMDELDDEIGDLEKKRSKLAKLVDKKDKKKDKKKGK